MTKKVYLRKSNKKDKKYMVTIDNKTVHFGASGYSDYTKHKDNERMKRYTSRHKSRENWGKSGIKTAGFWSKWLLWNKPSISASISNIQNKFNIKIVKGKPPNKIVSMKSKRSSSRRRRSKRRSMKSKRRRSKRRSSRKSRRR